MASSADTFTRPSSRRSTASSIAMTAIGWRAAPPWSSIATAGWRSSNGPPSGSSPCSRPASWASLWRAERATPLHLALVTDAWAPQVNGVVRTLQRTKVELERLRQQVDVISPDQFRTVPCPTYPEIRLALWPERTLHRKLDALKPDAIHIATEGPLGRAARAWCLKQRLPFTTAYHTRFPEYVAARFAVPLGWTYSIVRRFHAPATRVMVATQSIENELTQRGFANISRWTRGVDLELFRPDQRAELDLPRPIHLYVGRVAVEKNIGAFLALKLPGSKVVIGDGPQLAALKARYPDVHFLGAKYGPDLARHVAAADVFVFPSLTDTF